MSLGRHSFKLNDATRFVRALKAAGLSITRVELDEGKIIAVTSEAITEATAALDPHTALDLSTPHGSAIFNERIKAMRAKGKRHRG